MPAAPGRRLVSVEDEQTPYPSGLQLFKRFSQGLILHPCVDFGSADMAVPKCSLDKSQVPTLPVEVHSKAVASAMNCEVTIDVSLGEPMMEAELYLTSAKWTTIARWKQRIIGPQIHFRNVRLQDPPELRCEIHGSLNPALAIDP